MCHSNEWQDARIEIFIFLRSDVHHHWLVWCFQLRHNMAWLHRINSKPTLMHTATASMYRIYFGLYICRFLVDKIFTICY